MEKDDVFRILKQEEDVLYGKWKTYSLVLCERFTKNEISWNGFRNFEDHEMMSRKWDFRRFCE